MAELGQSLRYLRWPTMPRRFWEMKTLIKQWSKCLPADWKPYSHPAWGGWKGQPAADPGESLGLRSYFRLWNSSTPRHLGNTEWQSRNKAGISQTFRGRRKVLTATSIKKNGSRFPTDDLKIQMSFPTPSYPSGKTGLMSHQHSYREISGIYYLTVQQRKCRRLSKI